jgi:5-oxoprolinase (ATP-hydrolysing) subunit A
MIINCDLGESLAAYQSGLDADFMGLVDAVNIACTYHAGSEYIILKTVENAIKNKVLIGFHPGFNDTQNFGRKELTLSEAQVKFLIFEQYEIFQKVVKPLNVRINHMKPHGALYNMSAQNQNYARAIASALFEIDPNIELYGLAESYLVSEGLKAGLKVKNEVFADRKYDKDRKLLSRELYPSAVLHDFSEIEAQARALINQEPILSHEGVYINLKAETICVHSDTPSGLEIAKLLKKIVSEKN